MKRAIGISAAAGAAYGIFRAARRATAPSLLGKVAIVTGGSRGLGLAIARELANEGARLVLAARNQADLEEARRDLELRGAVVQTAAVDLGTKAGAEALVERTIEYFGGLDLLVNNAGTIQVGPLDHMDDDDFETAMDIHFWAVHHLTQAALPHLRRSSVPRIVNIASIGGEMAVPHMAPYVASKFALVGYSETLRAELSSEGVLVTTVSPGLMRTGSHVNALFKGQREKEYAWFSGAQGIPLFSTSAERAARKIVSACRSGQPHLTITAAAKLAIAADAVAPNLTAYARDLVARLLPDSASPAEDVPRKGREVDGKAPDTLTHLADKEVESHNQT